jgi:hypothetical protein
MTERKQRRRFTKRDNVITRRYVRVLGNRAEFLAGRIANYRPGLPGEDNASRDKAELAALRWAMKVIGMWIADDPMARKEPEADEND